MSLTEINSSTTTGCITTTTYPYYDENPCDWSRVVPITNYPIVADSYPVLYTPEVKAIEIKGKILFYYYDENKNLFFTVYGESKKMEFKKSDDLIELLRELGLFE
jgi:hypothetical protein